MKRMRAEVKKNIESAGRLTMDNVVRSEEKLVALIDKRDSEHRNHFNEFQRKLFELNERINERVNKEQVNELIGKNNEK